MTALITAAIGLLTLICTGVVWWLHRKQTPTREERKDDVQREYSQTLETIHKLRAQGNHVAAEEMLRRLQQQYAPSPVVRMPPDRVPDNQPANLNPSPTTRKLMADRPATGLPSDSHGGSDTKPVEGGGHQ